MQNDLGKFSFPTEKSRIFPALFVLLLASDFSPSFFLLLILVAMFAGGKSITIIKLYQFRSRN